MPNPPLSPHAKLKTRLLIVELAPIATSALIAQNMACNCGIGKIIKLLKNIAQKSRKCKNKQKFPHTPLRQILSFCHKLLFLPLFPFLKIIINIIPMIPPMAFIIISVIVSTRPR